MPSTPALDLSDAATELLTRTPGPGETAGYRPHPPAPPAGVLYLSPHAAEPLARIRSLLKALGVAASEPHPGMLALPLRPALLERLVIDFDGLLSVAEAAATRALIVPEGREPTIVDLMNTQPLTTLFAGIRHRWLGEVLREDRLETHFQPILTAASHAVYGYECLIRGVDAAGRLIPPKDLFTAARAADMLFQLDRQARVCAIRSAAARHIDSRLFLNFNPASVYTPAFCLKSTFKAVDEVGIDPARIIFEVVETEEVRDTGHLLGILETYRAAGFGVALDDVGAGYSSLNLLARLRPDYVKLDMGLTRGVDRDPYKAGVAGKLLEMARDLGVKTVVEGVETPGESDWAVAQKADLVQGFYYARPAAEPPLRA